MLIIPHHSQVTLALALLLAVAAARPQFGNRPFGQPGFGFPAFGKFITVFFSTSKFNNQMSNCLIGGTGSGAGAGTGNAGPGGVSASGVRNHKDYTSFTWRYFYIEVKLLIRSASQAHRMAESVLVPALEPPTSTSSLVKLEPLVKEAEAVSENKLG